MKKISLIAIVATFPTFFCYGAGGPNAQSVIEAVFRIIKLAIPLVFGLALLAFFWGLAKFIFHAGNEDRIEEGKRIMLWGIIALFVMVSIWGLVSFMQEAFGLDRLMERGVGIL